MRTQSARSVRYWISIGRKRGPTRRAPFTEFGTPPTFRLGRKQLSGRSATNIPCRSVIRDPRIAMLASLKASLCVWRGFESHTRFSSRFYPRASGQFDLSRPSKATVPLSPAHATTAAGSGQRAAGNVQRAACLKDRAPDSSYGSEAGIRRRQESVWGLRCLIPRFDGAILSSEWKEAIWDRYVTGAPRPRTPSEQQYSDRKLRSRR